jgi:1-acyl-sn-glycerol-3-phosphate acyltransferase
MSNKKIQDKSLGYELIKSAIQFMFPKFFRQTEIRGLENVPPNQPLIFAGNHQNGVMDPLAIILFQKDPIVYMGRADIFSSWLNRILLRFIKVTPVYRIRDGFENLSKNDQQIKEAIDVLLDCKRLGVMPEGNHGEQHKLRPLVKGLFRIGYQAEIQLDGNAHVKIIPVGIDYNFYQHSGADLVLIYGKPIEIKEYLPLYLENPAIGLNTIRMALATSLSEIMLDIRSQDYDRTYRLCCYGVPAYLDYLAEKGLRTEAETMAGLRYDARVALANLFDRMETEEPETLQELDALTNRLNQLPGYPAEIMEWMEETPNKIHQFLLGFIAVALLPGFALNLPSWLVNRFIVSNVEDKQMHGTFVFTLGMAFNLVVYVVVTVVIGNLLSATLLQLAVLLFFIGSLGLVSEKARQYLRIPWKKLQYSFGGRKAFVNACKADYVKLKSAIGKIVSKKEL